MTKPHSHRGEPREEEPEDDREQHAPAHIATDHDHAEQAEEQPA